MGFHVGQTFGDYQITAVLGAGGMGRVYKVEHCITKRTEAMKVLAAELASDVQIKRFEREMRALARLSHPNIAGLHNAVHSENQLILLMEYIEGETLESVFIAGRLPLDTGIGYIKQILSALVYAHQQGVVHRDITPANVIVTPRGDVKLTDFGLSKSYGDSLLTSCGEVLGALPYLAPEQLKGTTQPDWRSDLYSVGAILYEHLTGEKPFGANRRLAPVLTDSEGEPRLPSEIEPSLSGGWDQIIRAALARDPSRRYQSAQEFLDAIDHLAQPTSESDLPLPHLRKAGIGIAIVAGLALAGFASPVLKQFREVKPATVALPRWHIAPPDFATVKTPVLVATPRPAKLADVRPAKEVVHAASPVQTVSTALPPPITIPPPLAPVAISAPNVVEPVAPDAAEPIAPEVTEPGAAQDPTTTKRGFWSKFNVFRKKSADPKEKP